MPASKQAAVFSSMSQGFMKRPRVQAISSLLCLTTAWSTQMGAWAVPGENTGEDAVTPQPRFAVAKPVLDTTPTPRLKPFTLGAKAVDLRSGADDGNLRAGAAAGQDDPLKADTNYTTDPFSRPPLSSGVNTSRFNLQANEVVRLLSKYNVELFVDRSQSMNKKDCPGGLSRWQWCGEQASGLANAISPLVPQGLTIVPFATEYDVFDHASAANIETLFSTLPLQFGTRLYEPMAEQFDTYFANHTPSKKPLLVVVITDGVPVPKIEPVLVRQELVAASNRSKPHEVTVVFCQIGCQDAEGQAYLQDLDQNLGQYGARYDIVHTINFQDLQQYGLGPALAASLQKYAPPPAPEPAPIQVAHKLPVKVHPVGLSSSSSSTSTVSASRRARIARGSAE
jgi:hypothetical protein